MPLEAAKLLLVEVKSKIDGLLATGVILLAVSILGFAYIFWETYRATVR